jgi:hypothetical protein
MTERKRRKPGFTLCLEGIRLVEEEGLSVRAAANKSGYSAMAISRARKRMGFPPLPRGRKPAGETVSYAEK